MASSRTYYWDACLFYEVLGDEPVGLEKKAAIDEFLQDNKDEKNVVITSVLTHLEVIPTKLDGKKVGAERQYLGLFDGKKFLDVEISRNILMRAREIRDFYYRPATEGTSAKVMDAADAVHLATATIYEVEAFHTRDNDEKGSKIPLVSLYKWSGHDKLCGKYSLDIVSPEHDQKTLDLATPAPAPEAGAPDFEINDLMGISDAELEELISQIDREEAVVQAAKSDVTVAASDEVSEAGPPAEVSTLGVASSDKPADEKTPETR